MKSFVAIATAALVLLSAIVSGASHRNMRLGKATHHINKQLAAHKKYGNGSSIAVGGDIWPVSIYWTEIEVGTPLVRHGVVVDSGSSFLYLPGKGCKGCTEKPHNTRYDPSNSSTAKPLYFPFSSSYETCNPSHPLQVCTLSGFLYEDIVNIAGFGAPNTSAKVILGAIDSITTNTYQSNTIAGLMGMVGPTNQNAFNQLCVAGDFCKPVWAICMHEGTKANGTLTVGGVDESLADGPITYVPRVNPFGEYSDSYRMTVNNLSFAGNTLLMSNYQSSLTILDTGTNDILLPSALFQATQQSMCANSNLAHCNDFFSTGSNGKTACFHLTDAEIDAYPNLNFALENGVVLTMTARDYLLYNSPVATNADQVCFGIGNGGNLFILGDSIMHHYYLVFAPNTIGWGKVNKKTCGSQ